MQVIIDTLCVRQMRSLKKIITVVIQSSFQPQPASQVILRGFDDVKMSRKYLRTNLSLAVHTHDILTLKKQNTLSNTYYLLLIYHYILKKKENTYTM